jgi:AraC-like DNA-binding protein
LDEDRTLLEIEINAIESKKWDDVIQGSRDVVAVARLGIAEQTPHFRVIAKSPMFVAIFRQLNLMWLPPMIIMDGMSAWKVLGTNENIRMMVEELRRHSFNAVVEQMHPATTDVVVDYMHRKEELTRSLLSPSLEGLVPAGLRKDLVRALETPDFGEPTEDTSAKGTPEGSDRLTMCKVRVSIKEGHWLFDISRRHPEVVFDVMAIQDLGNGERYTDVRIRSTQMIDWYAELSATSQVLSVERVGAAGYNTDLRVRTRKTPIFNLMDELHILWRLPCPVKNGGLPMVVTGSEKSIRQLMKAVRTGNVQAEIEAVYRNEKGDEGFLTRRQTEVFSKAMAAGYFDVPRLITLTDLATELGMSSSSLSEILAKVEKKIVTEFHEAHPQ